MKRCKLLLNHDSTFHDIMGITGDRGFDEDMIVHFMIFESPLDYHREFCFRVEHLGISSIAIRNFVAFIHNLSDLNLPSLIQFLGKNTAVVEKVSHSRN